MNVDAAAFSERWVRNWNAHDVEAVLTDFHDDVVFTSPVAATLFPETGGVVRSKEAWRRYWTEAVARIPDLRFTVEGVTKASTRSSSITATRAGTWSTRS